MNPEGWHLIVVLKWKTNMRAQVKNFEPKITFDFFLVWFISFFDFFLISAFYHVKLLFQFDNAEKLPGTIHKLNSLCLYQALIIL